MPRVEAFIMTPRWSSKDKFVDQLFKFQKNEKEIRYDNYFRDFDLPLEQKVRKGIALKNITIKKLGQADQYRIFCNEDNNSKFRLGDYIIIHIRNGIVIKAEGMIISEDYNYYDVKLLSGSLNYSNDKQVIITMDYSYSDLTDEMIHSALLKLDNYNKRNLIINILEGKVGIIKNDSIGSKEECIGLLNNQLQYRFKDLDKSQKKAFFEAVINTPLSLIQGPPGTGKTLLLAFLCDFFASIGKKVLVTGFTHRSINNALKAIWKSTDRKSQVIKISDQTKTTEFTDFYESISVYKRFNLIPQPLIEKSGLIIGATPYEVTRAEFDNIDFDYVIFDEASQLQVNLAIMGMLRGKNFVFFGDHKQMKPIILGDATTNTLYKKKIFNRSAFELLFEYYGGVTLSVCYRMNPKLISFSSKMFYDGKVYTPPKSTRKLLNLSKNPTRYKEILNPRNVDVVIRLNHSKDNNKSNSEAILIRELINELIFCGISEENIGVIAPYRPQLTQIKNELRKLDCNSNKIIVETVERIQGQERDVIIFSLTRSNLETTLEELDFFFTPNRLNVALTRAKCKRIVIGSKKLFEKQRINKKIDRHIKVFTQFLNSADEIIDYSI